MVANYSYKVATKIISPEHKELYKRVTASGRLRFHGLEYPFGTLICKVKRKGGLSKVSQSSSKANTDVEVDNHNGQFNFVSSFQ